MLLKKDHKEVSMFKQRPEVAMAQKDYQPPAELNVAILHTIIAVTALRDILTQETDALKHSNSRLFLELQDVKVDAARRYETLVTNLMGRGAEIKKADPNLKKQLERLQQDFGLVAEENLRWIKRMESATKMLGETIMRAARKTAEAQTQFAYGASGKMQKGTKALIGLDEQA
jgi:hypothetical protein